MGAAKMHLKAIGDRLPLCGGGHGADSAMVSIGTYRMQLSQARDGGTAVRGYTCKTCQRRADNLPKNAAAMDAAVPQLRASEQPGSHMMGDQPESKLVREAVSRVNKRIKRKQMQTLTTQVLAEMFEDGAYAFPGGYPKFIVMHDGESLCWACFKANYSRMVQAVRENSHCGWRPVAADINYEDADLQCGHCAHRIESAYAEEATL